MNPLFRIPIRLQLIIIVVIVALPAAGTIIYAGLQQRSRAIIDARMDSQRLADRIASEQRILVASAQQLAVSLSQLPEIKEKDPVKVNLFLRNIIRLHPSFTILFIADTTGTIWASALPFTDSISIRDRRYFKNALESGQLSSGEFQVGRISQKPTLNFGYPYRTGHRGTAGVVGIGISLEGYVGLPERFRLPSGTDITLIDHKGSILFSSVGAEKEGRPSNPVVFKKMLEGPDADTVVAVGIAGDLPGKERYVSYRKLRLEGEQSPYLYVRVGIPVGSVLSQANKQMVENLSLFALILASSLFLAWLVGKRSIADRIALLERASQSLAQGDLRVRVTELIRGGELGRLGKSFDAMAVQLLSREESLSKSERFLNTIIDTEPECLKLLDAEGRVLMMNPAGLNMIGAESFEQVKGQSIFPLITPKYRDAFMNLTGDVFQGVSGNLEFEAVGLKGRHLWFETHAVPFRNDAGEIVSLLGITRDITDRKLADQALRQREADLRKAQEIAKLGSWTYGMSGPISWSDEMYRIYGVTPETFTPTEESFLSLIHPDDRDAMKAWIAACAAGKKPGELEYRVIWPDGTIRLISGRGELVQDDEGREIRMTGTAQDMTEHKQAEEALAKSESAFRATFEQAAVGMAQIAPDGRWVQVNQRLCDIVGYTRDELLALSYQDITHPDDLEADLKCRRSVTSGSGTCSLEKRYIRKDRGIVWINLTLRLVRDSVGAPAYFISVVEDISKRKLAEEALAEKQRLLKELNVSLAKRVEDAVAELRKKDQILISQGRQAAMGEMIGNIAHQWRQPLNTLGLIVQGLLMTYGRDEFYQESLQTNVGKAMSLIQHMSKTIDDFSNYFRPDKEKTLFNVNDAVAKALTLVESSLANLNINVEVIGDKEHFIEGYANEYSQVLLNILLNCRDAFDESQTGRDRVITINVFEEGNRSVVTLTDNAGGIPEGIIDRIFDPYFSTKGPDKGTGIGLYMAKTIIEKNMGGTLTVRNTADGAEFRIEV